jgi:hypothetical protein
MSDKESPTDIHEVNEEHGTAEAIDRIAGKKLFRKIGLNIITLFGALS